MTCPLPTGYGFSPPCLGSGSQADSDTSLLNIAVLRAEQETYRSPALTACHGPSQFNREGGAFFPSEAGAGRANGRFGFDEQRVTHSTPAEEALQPVLMGLES